MQLDFSTANRIIFGSGKLAQLPQLVSGYGRRALLVRSKNLSVREQILEMIKSVGVVCADFVIKGEPDLDMVQAGLELAREQDCDFVLGAGGGSVMDVAKAVAALLANPGDLMEYLEVVGKGQKLVHPSKPVVTIPTTAGTGSEVTRNAVISVPSQHVKVSMRSPYMLPAVALVDPELTFSMPPALTASTGMDAFIQVIEPYVSVNHNPMVDMFCRDAIPRAARNLFAVYQDGGKSEARTQMSWVSLMGGLSLANAGLGAAHGFAGPIGGMFSAAHGVICAAIMPAVMAANVAALEERDPHGIALLRYGEIAEWMTGKPDAKPREAADWMRELSGNLNIPCLADLGVTTNDFDMIVQKSAVASSMKGNPVQLTEKELSTILENSL